MAPIRIAVLECDTPLTGTQKKYGGYGGVFTSLLTAAAEALGLPKTELDISKWDVVSKQEYPYLKDVDGVLLTGSKHNSFDDVPWINKLVEFVKRLLSQDRVRLIGVCFGHQIVGRAMGAKVARSDGGWEASVCQVDLNEQGMALFGKDVLNIHQMHKDIVYGYPIGVEALGSSPVCENQGMYIHEKLITVQGHPEFNKEIVTELLERRFEQGVFNASIFEDGMARVGKGHDGLIIAKAFLTFLMERRSDTPKVDFLSSTSWKASASVKDGDLLASG